MPLVNMNAQVVPEVPAHLVTVGGSIDRGLFCTSIRVAGGGTYASFRAPLLSFSSDKRAYMTQEIAVYVEDHSTPIFRGYMDTAESDLRTETVNFTGRSVYSKLRERSTALRDGLIFDDGLTNTFVNGGAARLTDSSPYVVTRDTFMNWTPSLILGYFQALCLGAEFTSKISFHVDETAMINAPYESFDYKWVLDGAGKPTLTAVSKWHSSLGEQSFRLTTWGALIDYLASLMPGVEVYEVFTESGTILWFAPPFRNGYIQGTGGVRGMDWRDVGANITDMNLHTDNGSTVNRFVGIGHPASFTVTVMSNSQDENGYLTGLIPAWEVFDIVNPEATVYPHPVEGVAEWNYVSHAGTTTVSLQKQNFHRILENSFLGDKSSSSYQEGYEHVGRRWRLPNWFRTMELERGADMFSDPDSGARVNTQVFVEKAVWDNTLGWRYEWVAYTDGVSVDHVNKMFTLETVPITYVLTADPNNPSKHFPDVGFPAPQHSRLCRVAITLTYTNRQYTPYADTWIESGGFIDPSRITGLTSGQALVFERSDIKFSQLTNIGKPIYGSYAETWTDNIELIESQGSWSYQALLPEAFTVTYSDLMVEAYADGRSGISLYIPTEARHAATDGVLVAPLVVRDDTVKLHRLVWELYSWRGKRARHFSIQFGWLSPGIRRGMMLLLKNIRNYANDWDSVETITHDLERGTTTITTTNQPGNSLDVLMMEMSDDA